MDFLESLGEIERVLQIVVSGRHKSCRTPRTAIWMTPELISLVLESLLLPQSRARANDPPPVTVAVFRAAYWLTDSITRPLAASAISIVTVVAT
jgi:hypothetical protein